MWDVAIEGLRLVVQWPAIGYMVFGVVVGLYVGAVPGLGGIVAMSILLPFTFDMDAASAFAMLLGMYAVTCTGDTLSSVLLGVPGTAASQATILDGYPLAQKGEAARAFGAAYTVSAIGGILGALVLGLSIPVIRPLILAFAQPEFFMLGVLGLTMVGALSGNSIAKGLVSAMFGLMVAQVGYSVQGGTSRFDFGLVYLLDGMPLVPVVLGFFAIPELISLAVRNESIAKIESASGAGDKALMLQGIRDAFRHWWLVLRCSVIGMYVGMLPGVGGSIVDWLAYGYAVQSAKDKSQFGKGDIRGVIAPESANNATRGPALIPTAAFGIPGTASMAVLLGAFLIQGLTPGPEMLKSKLDLTFSFVWTLVIANVLGAGLMMLWSRQLARATFLRGNLIVPSIILFVFMGAWMSNRQIGDWYVLLLFGVIGYVMKSGGWPRPPFVLGFILGPIMENALDISIQAFGWEWLLRPITLTLLVIVVGTLLYALLGLQRRRRPLVKPAQVAPEPMDPSVSVILGLIFLAVFVYGFVKAQGWSLATAMLPLATTVPGMLLAAAIILTETKRMRAAEGGFGVAFGAGFGDTASHLRGVCVLLWLIGVIVATVLLSQLIAIPLIMLLYLRFWAHERWTMAVGQAIAGLVFLYLMFELAIPTVWFDSILF